MAFALATWHASPRRAAPRRGTTMCAQRARREDEEVKLDLVEGHLENANVRPRLDIDVNDKVLLLKLRRMLTKADFDRIFNSRDHRIGEL